jgi:transposase
VAVPGDRDDEPIRKFASFTADLNRLADRFTGCGVDTVAMESTGVYWIALFELLDARGFDVLLVSARHLKNVSGRKSDVLDCQWLRQPMSYGLLRGAFRPSNQVCVLRALARHAAAQAGPQCAAHAEGLGADEDPTGQRDRRRGRCQRSGNPAGHRDRRTQPVRPCRSEELLRAR